MLREGHINLSGLQLRAHAMFSAEGLPLGSDSLEYAWLIDVQAGSLTAKVTAPQVCSQVWEWYLLTYFLSPFKSYLRNTQKSKVLRKLSYVLEKQDCSNSGESSNIILIIYNLISRNF